MRWALPDRVFFACGAGHILAYAFLKRWGEVGWCATALGGLGWHLGPLADRGADFRTWVSRLRRLVAARGAAVPA